MRTRLGWIALFVAAGAFAPAVIHWASAEARYRKVTTPSRRHSHGRSYDKQEKYVTTIARTPSMATLSLRGLLGITKRATKTT